MYYTWHEDNRMLVEEERKVKNKNCGSQVKQRNS